MRTIIAFLILALAGLAGCLSDDSGSASIYVKDAPTDDFDEIHVVFTKVEIHAAGEDGDEGEDGEESEDGEWITVYENATGQDIDLLDASGARAAFLGEAELDAGRYTQIRIHSDSAYGIMDGERHEFDLSSTPLKVVKSFEIQADKETRIILDFDLDNSIHEQGTQGYRMTPVIGKTETQIVEDSQSGEDVHEEGEITTIE